jgi:hypothetical protein
MIVEGMKSAWEPGRGYARDDSPAGDELSDNKSSADGAAERPGADGEAGSEKADPEADIASDIDEDMPEEDPDLG